MGLINEYELVNTTKALVNHESSLAKPTIPSAAVVRADISGTEESPPVSMKV